VRVTEIMTRDFARVDAGASLDDAMERMDAEDVRHLPVLDGGRLAGVLSERDVLEVTGWLPPSVRALLEAPAGAVRDFMHAPVVTVSPEDSLATAAVRLLDWGIGCLPVQDERTLVGIVTELDLLAAYARACHGAVVAVASDPPVSSLMTADVLTAEPDTPAEDALAFCRANRIRHLVVQHGERLVGIVSDRDLRLSLGRGQLEGTPLSELLPRRLYTIEPDAKLSAAARLFVHQRIGALPVVEDGDRLVGLLSTKDVLRHCTRAFSSHRDATARG
jgi:CBS domain-containing protein